jgi:hypothetical protein
LLALDNDQVIDLLHSNKRLPVFEDADAVIIIEGLHARRLQSLADFEHLSRLWASKAAKHVYVYYGSKWFAAHTLPTITTAKARVHIYLFASQYDTQMD